MGTGNGNGSIVYDWHAIDTAFSDRNAEKAARACKDDHPKTDLKYYVLFTNHIREKMIDWWDKYVGMPLPKYGIDWNSTKYKTYENYLKSILKEEYKEKSNYNT